MTRLEPSVHSPLEGNNIINDLNEMVQFLPDTGCMAREL